MRNIYFLICILLSAGTIGFFSPYFDIDFTNTSSESNSYAVEIAKYKYPVYTDYFENIKDVLELTGSDGEYHYLSGVTNSKEDAEQLSKEIQEMGYSDARIVDLNEEFPSEELEDIVSAEPQNQDKKKITKRKAAMKTAEIAIGKLNNKSTSYFYTILLVKNDTLFNADHFAPLQNIKALKQDDSFYYLFGRFEDVTDAEAYLNKNLKSKYKKASVLVFNKGKLGNLSVAKKEKNRMISSNRANNMGRKMRGKEYHDYYYDLSKLKFTKKPVYIIELGPYDDKNQAAEAVQKLKDLGFDRARIQKPKKEITQESEMSPSAAKHYSIQVFASKSGLSISRFNLEVSRSYDQHDGLYRFLYGDYDNYWVCRRELRAVRKKGFPDAFIVKL